jgi:hypothetical protein
MSHPKALPLHEVLAQFTPEEMELAYPGITKPNGWTPYVKMDVTGIPHIMAPNMGRLVQAGAKRKSKLNREEMVAQAQPESIEIPGVTAKKVYQVGPASIDPRVTGVEVGEPIMPPESREDYLRRQGGDYGTAGLQDDPVGNGIASTLASLGLGGLTGMLSRGATTAAPQAEAAAARNPFAQAAARAIPKAELSANDQFTTRIPDPGIFAKLKDLGAEAENVVTHTLAPDAKTGNLTPNREMIKHFVESHSRDLELIKKLLEEVK